MVEHSPLMSMTPHQDLSSLLSLHDPFPNLDVILDTDLFTSVCSPVGGASAHEIGYKSTTGSNLEEFFLPDVSPTLQTPPSSSHLPFNLSNWNFGSNAKEYKESSTDGLDTILEYENNHHPRIYQPHIHPSVNVPSTSTYNISFPTTLQPRERSKFSFEAEKGDGHISKRPGFNQVDQNNSQKQEKPQENDDARTVKTNKRSRRSKSNGGTTSDVVEPIEELEIYTSEEKRFRKKCIPLPNSISGSHSSTENRRRDSIKQGLDELQRVLPHLGSPEEEKISQASILYEAGKFIKDSQAFNNKTTDHICSLKEEIEKLNREIEHFQSELPDNGVVLVPKVLASRSLADRFHDHVVEKTIEDWRYWVFTNIMGHFVHSFDREVDASSIDILRKKSSMWISKNMSLHQLRKDAYRKLAKLCAKTSIVDDPSKLPEEALGFVTKRDRLICTMAETVPDKASK
ncbi:uncharacterized protein [Lepeophtheirus salmonis]|uniref:uncharacterized protein isoform X2 n=1 Tax=Lepeophtheirus salmonis TaxID=72036 RepID=UPI001AEA8948|nr:uncharacterized protein LOC121118675 isoform X2 [Lepeophtheirus salmonis]